MSIDSRDFCKRFSIKHKDWMSNVLRKFLGDFEQLGTLRFQNAKSKGRETAFVMLNEEQANLATTFARNSDDVRAAKVQLIKDLSAYKLAAKLLWEENQRKDAYIANRIVIRSFKTNETVI